MKNSDKVETNHTNIQTITLFTTTTTIHYNYLTIMIFFIELDMTFRNGISIF